MRTVVQTVIVAVGIVNIILFAVWLSIIRATAITSTEAAASYHFDQISFQIAILQTVLVAMTIILAAAAFFGFQVVIERADRSAREVVQQLFKDHQLVPKSGTTVSTNPPPQVGSVQVQNPVAENL